jgi:hypothetical protein
MRKDAREKHHVLFENTIPALAWSGGGGKKG